MLDVRVRGDGIDKQGAMAAGGIALVAEDGTGLLLRERDHLRALGNRFRQFQLPGVDPL